MILLLKLRRNKEKLFLTKIRLKFCFLYSEYRNKGYFWEIVRILQKTSIIIIINFFYSYKKVKLILVNLIELTYLLALQMANPY